MKRIEVIFLAVVWRLCSSQNLTSNPSQSCPPLYRRYSTDHTFCRPTNGTCNIVRQGVSNADAAIIVATHNRLRSRVAVGNETRNNFPSSANHVQMVWDVELAAVAQKHAEQCQFAHDCGNCRAVENFSVGQNLFISMTSSTQIPAANWTQAVVSWNDEVTLFQPSSISPFKFLEAAGHFTQVQWAATWRVGCGLTVYRSSDTRYTYSTLYTCNYGPAGNVQNGEMYKVGNTCSQCPVNTCCGTACTDNGITVDYPGLCKSLDGRGPQPPPLATPNLLSCDMKTITGECTRTAVGVNSWQVRTTLSGNYISVVLNGSQSTEMKFTRSTRPSPNNTMCVTFKYRKGPNVAGEASNNVFQLKLYVPALSWTSTTNIASNSAQWVQYRMSAGWGNPTQVSFAFSVGNGGPPQYLDISDLLVLSGRC